MAKNSYKANVNQYANQEEAIRKAKTDSQTTITQKEQAIREATEKRLACQQKETEALAKARTASDSREEMGREMARLAERKAAAAKAAAEAPKAE